MENDSRIKCPLCESRFGVKSNLNKHIRVVHKVIGFVPEIPSSVYGPTAYDVQSQAQDKSKELPQQPLEQETLATTSSTN